MKWIKLYNRPNSIQRAEEYARGMGNPFLKYFGTGIFNWMNVFHDGTSDYYVDEKEIQNFEEYSLKKLVEDINFYNFILNDYENQFLMHEKYLREINSKDLGKLNNNELIELYLDYMIRITNCLSYMWLVAICEKPMEEALKIILKKYIPIDKIEESIKVVFSQTTDNYLSKEENDLLNIYKFGKNETLNLLKKHTEKFKVISMYDYDHQAYTIEHFRDRFKNLDKQKIVKNNKRIKENREKFIKLINEINLKEDDKIRIKGLNFLYNFKDQRSWFRSLDSYFAREIYFEISRRTNIDIKDILFMLEYEIIDILNGNLKQIDFREREDFCLVIFSKNNSELLAGKEAKNYLKNALEEFSEDKINGLTGYKGKVKGKVKIILKPSDLTKVENGDIIVASMTRPDYIFAMKKSGAIITDEGGITCHAAIVSREFKIPSIVGTKIATKVLKDGDLIEVDANKGIVKILERVK